MEPHIFKTARLRIRNLSVEDASELAKVLCDKSAMRFYPHPFVREEVDRWIARNRRRYLTDGFGLWAVEWLADGTFVGDCGLAVQPLEDARVVEIGYHILPDFQNRGIATEAAMASKTFARERLQLRKLHAFIRPENRASRRVAEKIGMHVERTLTRGEGDFLHEIWAVDLTGG